MIFTILVGLFIVFISTSYALWTVSVEKNHNLNIVVGVLNYELTSPELNGNKQVVVPANSEKRINITLKSLNAIDSDYSVYYQGSLPSGVTIMYDGTNSKPSDNISITGTTKSIGVIIVNKSSSNYTATLGVKGGLTNKGLALDSNTYQITNPYSFSKDYAYTGNYQTFTAPVSGYYNVEAWGAEGGSNWNSYSDILPGGKGSYTQGSIYLTKNETLYIYVGGSSTVYNIPGYNGGGLGSNRNIDTEGRGGPGGGATDIRLTSGTWNNISSLRSRIMVSAGGGGTSNWVNIVPGGGGGTLIGRGGILNPGNVKHSLAIGGGQNAGGLAGGEGPDALNSNGSFGLGGNASPLYGGGGGGGYNGGGGSGSIAGGVSSGAGGSSFISGFAGVNATDINGNYTNNTLHYSGKYFINGKMLAALNSGNGKAKISYIGSEYAKTNSKLNGVRYIKDCIDNRNDTCPNCHNWMELQAIKNGRNLALNKAISSTATFLDHWPLVQANNGIITEWIRGEVDGATSINGGNKCITVDLGSVYDLDEVMVSHSTFAYGTHTLSVSNNNSNWINLIDDKLKGEDNVGKRITAYNVELEDNYEFYYIGAPTLFIAPETGNYQIELWGADGAATEVPGGHGASTRGIINLIKGEQLYIYVGGMGHGVNGGYNGGGYGAVQSSTGGGGGATDIRTVGGNWNDIASLRSRIMVAAGGGGSATAAVGGAIGGYGGWLVAPEVATSTTPLQGRGGTQTSGGIFGPNASHPLNATSGGFGSGGTAGFYESGAGGGGYYGGGGGTHQTPNKSGSGGGGSSYISGHPGVNSINSSGIHTNSLIHWSGKSFKETLMLSGASMNTGGYANENGRARIVLLR